MCYEWKKIRVDVREVLFVDEKECLEGRRGRGSVHLTFILLP